MLGLYNNHPYWYAQPVLLIIALGLTSGVLVGVLLVLRPAAVLRLNARLSRWIDTSESFAQLDRPRTWERFFYRHHRLLGGLITAGAAYVLEQWAFHFDRREFLSVLGRRWTATGLDSIIVAGEWIVVGLHVLVLGIGLTVLFRPSQLKALERAANRWMQPAPASKLDQVYASVDRGVALYPRVTGLVVAVASLWCLARLYPAFEIAFGR